MNVLFIVEYYHPHTGGVETFFKSLVEQLDLQGHRVTVITNRYDPQLPKIETHGNTTIKRFRFYNRYLFTFGAWWFALKDARQADIIHTTSFNAAVPARLVSILTRTKCIITFHEVWGDLWYRLPRMSKTSARLHRFFETWICSFNFDRFVGVSDFTKKALIDSGISQDEVTRIYNGVNYNSELKHKGSDPDDPFTFLFFGRVSYSKGLDLLIPAIQDLKSTTHEFRIIMVIPSAETNITRDIKKQIQEKNLDDVIVGRNDLSYLELQKQIADSDAVVIPSYSEGFCYAAVETMAIGTPIISSGRGALSEVIGGRHIHFPTFNYKSLAHAMQDAIHGNWNIAPEKRFPLSNTIDQYLTLYKEVVGQEL